MHKLMIHVVVASISSIHIAAAADCAAKAAKKKLAGAAKNSFNSKCEKDAVSEIIKYGTSEEIGSGYDISCNKHYCLFEYHDVCGCFRICV